MEKTEIKDEQHKNIEDLMDKIMEVNETRLTESLTERKTIINSQWIETEMEKFYTELENLFQLEADKFLGSIQILGDVYYNLDNKHLIEIPFSNYEILTNEPVKI